MSYLAAGVAAKKGFFKEEGLDVEIIRMNANVAMSALIAGECDYTMIFASVIRAAMRGIPLKVIAVLIDSPPYAFIAKPGIDDFESAQRQNHRHRRVRQLQRCGCAHDAGTFRHRSRQGNQADRLRLRRRALRRAQRRPGRRRDYRPAGGSQARKIGLNVLARANDFFKFPHIGLGTSSKKIKERPQEVTQVIKAFMQSQSLCA